MAGFFTYDLAAPARLIFPVLSKTTPQPVEWWNIARGGWRENGRHVMSGWPLRRRHAHLVRNRVCHYDDGDVHTGKLHCFCGEHKQGVEYGLLGRVQHRVLQRVQGRHERVAKRAR